MMDDSFWVKSTHKPKSLKMNLRDHGMRIIEPTDVSIGSGNQSI